MPQSLHSQRQSQPACGVAGSQVVWVPLQTHTQRSPSPHAGSQVGAATAALARANAKPSAAIKLENLVMTRSSLSPRL